MPAAAGQLLPRADHWQVLTRCQQYRPGAPAEGSASTPVNLAGVSPAASRCFSRPAACSLAPGQRSGWAVWCPPPGGAVQRQGSAAGGGGTIGGYRRISFRAVAR